MRVPDARFRDVALFAQDEWRVRSNVSIFAGLRGDFYALTTEATPGYDVSTVVAGAVPAIDPATLPDSGGATYARTALTGDAGVVVNPAARSARSSASAAASATRTWRRCLPGQRPPAASPRTSR